MARPTSPQTPAEIAATYGILQRDAEGQITHCPLMLSPTPVSAGLLAQLEELTEPFSRMMHRVASDLEWLAETLRGAAATDAYTRFLLELAQRSASSAPEWRLAVTRSDYFATPDGEGLRQVELNTMAASYVGLASRIAGFHRAYGGIVEERWQVVDNQPTEGVVEGFAEALRVYGAPRAVVLLIAQAGERNIFDQRILEAALAERGIRVLRAELEELLTRARLRDGELLVDGEVAAITYFRAGYRPDELQSEEAQEARRMIASSSSICVPDLAAHLAGTKKVQQALTDPKTLARFLDPESAAKVSASFALLAALEEPIPFEGSERIALEAALERPEAFVLKPQREGGGFNVYGEQIREQLSRMRPEQREAYVLMERLSPPEREAEGLRAGQRWSGAVVCELGHFGVLLARGEEIRINRGVGYLARTKRSDQDEGGISSGAGHLDSLRLLSP